MQLNFVDLVGSEMVKKKSGSIKDKKLLKEAQTINNLLSQLDNVISVLSSGNPATYIP